MSEATISFADHDHIRMLFGARDRYLRQVRDIVGVDVVLRGDEVRLQGDDLQIKRGLEVFNELKHIIEKEGQLEESQVQRVLGTAPSNGSQNNGGEIELFERARKVRPRSPGQAHYVTAMEQNDLVFCAGPAGCGKTYLAVAMAVNSLRREQVRKIVLVRPAVEAGEKLGFLPGDFLSKVNPYLRPLLDALNDIVDFEAVKRYMENDVIEIAPLAYMRGRTLNQTFVILDEGQNTTTTQMKMFLTRMGNRRHHADRPADSHPQRAHRRHAAARPYRRRPGGGIDRSGHRPSPAGPRDRGRLRRRSASTQAAQEIGAPLDQSPF